MRQKPSICGKGSKHKCQDIEYCTKQSNKSQLLHMCQNMGKVEPLIQLK